ncbi:hypothetical protein DLAC_11730 [Tieghemostelium lacteum]|uniref:EGF-like domain-containing protein n=1 Tax=Tieghemostelium lacteum TaxID=361077 RepID=A0A151Z7S2_TIELA|nr:hypothetical protein DLAC_11730 [Tieghemostelium lacteum]|eukprot:KYQ89987.1 hypothetical protein DLAC_11730 [Tieghemostelium lacteum]
MPRYLFIFLIFSTILFTLLSSYEVINLTQQRSNDVYAQNIDYCTFKYQILLKAESNDIDITSVETKVVNSTISLLLNDTRNYFFEFQLDIPLNTKGNISDLFLVNENDSIGGIIDYHCETPPHPLVNKNPYKQFRRMGLSYYVSLHLGLSKQLTYVVKYPQPINFICANYDQGYSYITISCFMLSLSTTIPDFQFDIIDSQNRSTPFTFPSFINIQDTANSMVSTYEYFDDPTLNTGSKQYYYFTTFSNLKGIFYHINNSLEATESPGYNEPITGNLETTFTSLYFTSLKSTSTYTLFTQYLKGNQIQSTSQISYTPTVIANGPAVNINIDQAITTAIDFEIQMTVSNLTPFTMLAYQGVSYQYIIIGYPNNLVGKIGNNYQYKLVFMLSDTNTEFILYDKENPVYNTTMNSNLPVDTTPPVLERVELIPIDGVLFLIRVIASDDNGVVYITVNSQMLTKLDLVSGTFQNGTFEQVVNITYEKNSINERNVILYDFTGNFENYDNVYGSDFKEIPSFASFLPQYGTMEISFIRFAMNDIDLSLIGCNNTMFINFTNPVINQIVKIDFTFESFSGIWDPDEQLFVVEFQLNSLMFSNYLEYIVGHYYQEFDSRNFPEAWKLRVYSDYADKMPPMITNIVSSPPISNTQGGNISWTFTIDDQYHGLKYGVVSVSSTLETHNQIPFILETEGKNIYSDNYTIELQVPPGCLAQNYFISNVYLIDNGNADSSQDTSSMVLQTGDSNFNTNISPFMRILNNTSLLSKLSIPVDCLTPNSDVTPPDITSLLIYSNDNSTSSINLFSTNRSIYINFTVQDTESPISPFHIPTCYFYSVMFKLEVEATAISFDDSTFTAQFQCVYPEVNYGYGFPYPKILISINAFSDIKLNIKGYSSDDLQVAGFNSSIETVFIKQPIISSTSPIPNTGDQLTVFGYGFGIENTTTLKIDFEDSTTVFKNPVFLTDTFLIVDGIKPDQSKFNITAINLIQSNVLLVEPYFIPQPKPQIPCEGNPICGGPSNGVCTFFGCVCFYPWTSNDCMSQIIIIPQPGIIPKKPNLDLSIPLPGGEEVTLSSLITIDSLRE